MLNYKPENGKTEKKDLWVSRKGKLQLRAKRHSLAIARLAWGTGSFGPQLTATRANSFTAHALCLRPLSSLTVVVPLLVLRTAFLVA